jgi:hypothetical protein
MNFSSAMVALMPVHLTLPNLIIQIDGKSTNYEFLIMKFIKPCISLVSLSPNTLLNTLFSDTLSQNSSPNVRDKVLFLYRGAVKSILL